MIEFPIQPSEGPILLPAVYKDGNSRFRFQLDRAEDGTITIDREKYLTDRIKHLFEPEEFSSNFTNLSTTITIPPSCKTIEIEHKEQKMIPEWRYKFEAPDHHGIADLARAIVDQGTMNEATAKKLSSRIDMEVTACKEQRMGRIVEKTGGWREAIRKFSDGKVSVQPAVQ